MLVLSRKQAESIFINGNVVVTVLSIQGTQVRLGIEAPTGMPVHRREVHERIGSRDAARDVG
jgi:carbon storage regulator